MLQSGNIVKIVKCITHNNKGHFPVRKNETMDQLKYHFSGQQYVKWYILEIKLYHLVINCCLSNMTLVYTPS